MLRMQGQIDTRAEAVEEAAAEGARLDADRQIEAAAAAAALAQLKADLVAGIQVPVFFSLFNECYIFKYMSS